MDDPTLDEPVKPYTSVRCAKEAKEVLICTFFLNIPYYTQE